MSDELADWPGYRNAPEYLNLATEVLDSSVARGDALRAALVGEHGTTSYPQLQQQVNSLAAGLGRLGLRRGDLALIKMSNSREFAMVFLAAVKLGVVPVLVNSLLSAGELRSIVEQSQPKLIFTEAARADAVRELRANGLIYQIVCRDGAGENEISFESLTAQSDATVATANTRAKEPAFIVYTSGTTGKPKGIVHAHRWIIALGDLNRYRLPPQANDVVMATGEWSFISALGHNLLFPLRNGVTGAVLSGRATPDNILAAIEKFRVTVLYSVATVYRRLLASADFETLHDLSSLRCAHSTGEALREATYNEWKRRVGSEFYEHYGVSEYQLVIGHGMRHAVKPGSVGKLLPGVGVAILDDEFHPVKTGDLGQFAISTEDPGLFLGYYKDDERTRAAVRNGWYFTGDLAYQDEEGYFYVAGRRDDCFKSRGIFISPTEIENALQKHPAIVEAAVVAVPDAEIGNKIRAVVALSEGHKANEELAEQIRDGLRSQLAPYKIPHVIEFATSLPKSAVGKILRAALSALAKE
ncbi:MAG TPA: acyl-CoA synthetase [Candidatus Limnocylindrales bacterium]|nr:acyl-CoA synthetase [Candidatus Limnocylindrales bacterium]